jgi:hypothetical protein
MVIIYTDIKKTNNHLYATARLNSDGHQLHQYLQREQSRFS